MRWASAGASGELSLLPAKVWSLRGGKPSEAAEEGGPLPLVNAPRSEAAAVVNKLGEPADPDRLRGRVLLSRADASDEDPI